jgi:predicted dehydrogenase
MAQELLRTAVIGLAQHGSFLMETAVKTGRFKIEVLADKDLDLAARLANEYGARAFDDYRSALAQNDLDVVISAAGLAASLEHIRAAFARGLHVLRIAPPARTTDELVSLISLANDAKTRFAVASTWRCRKVFAAFADYLATQPLTGAFLITARCGPSPWHDLSQRDPKLAGGGILLHSCYQMLDQIIANFPNPDLVACWQTSQAHDRQQRLYVTEDTALIVLKFSDTLVADIVASRTFPHASSSLSIYSPDRRVELVNDRLTVFDSAGRLIEDHAFPETESHAVSKLMINFADTIDSQETMPASSALDNLDTMALVDAAYLSTRTAVPESPQKIAQLAQTAINRILK